MNNLLDYTYTLDVDSDPMKTGFDLKKFRMKKKLSMPNFIQKIFEASKRRYSLGHMYEVEKGLRNLSEELKQAIQKVKNWD